MSFTTEQVFYALLHVCWDFFSLDLDKVHSKLIWTTKNRKESLQGLSWLNLCLNDFYTCWSHSYKHMSDYGADFQCLETWTITETPNQFMSLHVFCIMSVCSLCVSCLFWSLYFHYQGYTLCLLGWSEFLMGLINATPSYLFHIWQITQILHTLTLYQMHFLETVPINFPIVAG